MGTFKLKLTYNRDLADCAEVAERMRDFSEPLQRIIDGWAQHNVEKFGAGMGREDSGAVGGPLTPASWLELRSAEYQRRKHAEGYPNWLMVRTGNLMESLIDPSNFGQYISPNVAIWGHPFDEDATTAAKYNQDPQYGARRPTIFLSESDRDLIRSELSNYIKLTPAYISRRNSTYFSKGKYIEAELAMDIADLQEGEAIE